MNVLISPNAFKGTISAQKAGEIIAELIKFNFENAKVKIAPIADGGDGTCQLLSKALKLEEVECWSLNAHGQPLVATFGIERHASKAYLDVSTASGLGSLGKEKLFPRIASTYGTGLLIQKAIELGANEIILGLGGSATIDLGIGILSALGIEFLDENGRSLTFFSPNYLQRIKHIQRTTKIPKIKITCLCDVKNQLFGENGAVPVFGPQKGLKEEEFNDYESLLKSLIQTLYGKSTIEFEDQLGFGAAGGIAAGLNSFFPIEVKIGSPYFFEQIDLKSKIDWADLVITGEGRYDSQSSEGKAAYELLGLSKNRNKKIALVSSGNDGLKDGFDLVITLPNLEASSKNIKQQAEEDLIKALKNSFEDKFWT